MKYPATGPITAPMSADVRPSSRPKPEGTKPPAMTAHKPSTNKTIIVQKTI